MIWDVLVVGGGPAGMMAAGRAAELGAKVLILEKNEKLGKKLLITGGGRCNVTNAEPDTRKILEKFKEAKNFLFSPFSQWNNINTIEFFTTRGMSTKIENEGRVFPVSNSAQSVWDVMKKYIDQGNVTVQYNSSVSKILTQDQMITGVLLKGGEEILAKNIIIATGGKSRPETGSTGDAFTWLSAVGHTITEPNVSLVPVAIEDMWVKELQGKSLEKVKITTIQNDQKQKSSVGKILFTHFGITGPTILNMSRDISELLKYGPVDIYLDLFPGIDLGTLNKQLTEIFHKESNKKIKNVLDQWIPSAMVAIVLEKAGVDPDMPCHSVPRASRLALIDTTKALSMRVRGLLGTDKAIVTSGGVELSEMNVSTMSSKLYPNLFIVGDMLNIDRPSGGYGLQLCWTTGFVAGTAAAKTLS
jgi:predicted Rossmann fold flavoprotein